MIFAQLSDVNNPWMALAILGFFALQAWQLWLSKGNSGKLDVLHTATNSTAAAATYAAKHASDVAVGLAADACAAQVEAAYGRGKLEGQANLAEATDRAFRHGVESGAGTTAADRPDAGPTGRHP